jgi:hypothetical protein
MSRKRFILITAVLLCNLAALLLVAWVGFRKTSTASSLTAPTAPSAISIQLGRESVSKGIQLIEWAKDGATEAASVGGSECRFVRSPPRERAFMYFAIDPSFKESTLMNALVTVEYFDREPGEFRLNYDAVNLPENKSSRYETAGNKQETVGSQQWKKAYFLAHNARFQNSQNGGADFRLEARVPELHVRRVTMELLSDRL